MSIFDKFPYEKIENGRFLTLNGIPVPKYKSGSRLSEAWRAVAGHLETPETLVSALFTAAAIGLAPEVANGILYTGNFLMATIVSKTFAANRVSEYAKSRKLYFDTKSSAMNTKSQDYILAKKLRYYNAYFASGMAVGVGVVMFAGGLEGSASILFPTTILTHGFNAYRFNKVLKGEWQLTDTTPQQEEKESKTNMVPSPSY